jgi:hypothetical protein
LFVDESCLQDQHRTCRLGSEMALGSLLYAQHGWDNADAFDRRHSLNRRRRWRLGKKLEHCAFSQI